MDNKRKEKLIKLYNENTDAAYKYYSIANFVGSLKSDYEKYIKDLPEEEAVRSWINILDFQHNLVYLGVIESLRNNDYRYLDNALYTYVNIGMIKNLGVQSSYDHCILTVFYTYSLW